MRQQPEIIEKAQQHSQTGEHTGFLKLLSQAAVFYPTWKAAQAVHEPTHHSGSHASTIAQRSSPGKQNTTHNVLKCHSKPVSKILPLWPSWWLKNFHSTSVIHLLPCVGIKQQLPTHMTKNLNMQGTKNPCYCHPAKGNWPANPLGEMQRQCCELQAPLQGKGDRA